MSKRMKNMTRKLSEDLNRMLAKAPRPKTRVDFHRSSETHGEKSKTDRNRHERRTGRQRGWDQEKD